MKNTLKKYIVSFELTQRGDYTDWIEAQIRWGLRKNESINNLIITEVDNNLMNLTEDEV